MKSKRTKMMLATLVMTMTIVPTVITTTKAASNVVKKSSFADLGAVSQAKQDAIQQAVSQGLLTGDANGQFHPNSLLTRQELAVLLVNALHLQPVKVSSSSYKDVKANDWSAPYIEAARRAGLMSGNDLGSFRPTAPISREELAAVYVRAINGVGAHGDQNASVKDSQSVSSWAKDAIDTALQLQLIDTPNGKLNPKGNLQRQDIAPLLLHIFQTQERSAVITKVDGDFVTVDGKQFLIDGKLKDLLGDRNNQALQGAVLNYKSTNLTLGDIGDLELVQKDATIDLGSSVINGSLKISADGVTVKGQALGQVIVQPSVTNLTLGSAVKNLTVSGDQLHLSGSGTIASLNVTNADAKVSLGTDVKIDSVQLPTNVKFSQVFTDLGSSSQQVNQVGNGIDDRHPQQPVVPTPPAPPTPPKNHNPQPTSVDAITSGVSDGAITKSVTDMYSDEDAGDTLTFGANPTSSNTSVATATIDGTGHLVITPVAAGTATISVTATDGHGTYVDNQITVTFTPAQPTNHAPTWTTGLDAVSIGEQDQPKTISFANVFTDEDSDDTLTYVATSSDTGVATVQTSGTDLIITPVGVGTANITITATDSHGASNDTPLVVPVTVTAAQPATPKGLFISETVYGADHLQAIELYNPTGEAIDGSLVQIKSPDDAYDIDLSGYTIDPGKAFVIMETAAVFLDGTDLQNDYDYSFGIGDADPQPLDVMFNLYYDGQVVDVAKMHQGESLTRKPGTTIGTATGYNEGEWTIENSNTGDDLGKFDQSNE